MTSAKKETIEKYTCTHFRKYLHKYHRHYSGNFHI